MADHRFPQLGPDGYVSPYSDIDYSKGPKVIYGDTDVLRLILNDPQTDEDDEWGRTEHIGLRQLTDEAIEVRKALFGWSSVSGLLDKWNDFEDNHFDIDYVTFANSIFTIGDTTLRNGQLQLAAGTKYTASEFTMNSEYWKMFKVGTFGMKVQAGDNSGGAGDVTAYWYPAAVSSPDSDAAFILTVNNAEYRFTDSALIAPTGISLSVGDFEATSITAVDAVISDTLTVGTSSTVITTDSISIASLLNITTDITGPESSALLTFPGGVSIEGSFDAIGSQSFLTLSAEFLDLKGPSSTLLSFTDSGGSTSASLSAQSITIDAESSLSLIGNQEAGSETITINLFGGSYTQNWVFEYEDLVGNNIYLPANTRFGINPSSATDSVALISEVSGSGTGFSIKSTAYSGTFTNLVINATIQGFASGPFGLTFENAGSNSPSVIFREMPVYLWKSSTDTYLLLTHEQFHLSSMLKVSHDTGTDVVWFDLGGAASGYARLEYNPSNQIGLWNMNSLLIGTDNNNYAALGGGYSVSPFFAIKEEISGDSYHFRISIEELMSGSIGLSFSDISDAPNYVFYFNKISTYHFEDSDNYLDSNSSGIDLYSSGATVARMNANGFATEKGDFIKWQFLSGIISVPAADGNDDFAVAVSDEVDPTRIIGISASLPNSGNPDSVGSGASSYTVRYDAIGGPGNHRIYFRFPASHPDVSSGNRPAYVTIFYV